MEVTVKNDWRLRKKVIDFVRVRLYYPTTKTQNILQEWESDNARAGELVFLEDNMRFRFFFLSDAHLFGDMSRIKFYNFLPVTKKSRP